MATLDNFRQIHSIEQGDRVVQGYEVAEQSYLT